MSASLLAARRASSEALHSGGRVRFSRFSLWRCGLGALLLLIAISIHFCEVTEDQYPWYSTAATALVSLLGVSVFVFAWGSDRNAAVQFSEQAMLVWDWRGRQSAVAYDGIRAVRVRRAWDWWSISVFRQWDGEDSEWDEVVRYPTSSGWLMHAIAAELAARCGLVERSGGLWSRLPPDESR